MICSVNDLMKKIIPFLCSILILTGCSRTASSVSEQTVSADSMAESVISALSLKDMEAVKKRVIVGAFFDENKDICSDAAVYMSKTDGNMDTVGVFLTDQKDICIQYLQNYLSNLKDQSQSDYPTEVFKISNAVVESNDHMVVMIICENIEEAKSEAAALLAQ